MPTNRSSRHYALVATVISLACFPTSSKAYFSPRYLEQNQSYGSLTPLQMEIEKQRNRLSSADGEERRDAITRLGAMHHPDASRAALPGLKDSLPVVRATAAATVLSLPAEESVRFLVPLLGDKNEFVRKEAAYAVGKTRSSSAVAELIARFQTDKSDEVKGAAAVALGQIGDAGAVLALASALHPSAPGKSPREKKKKITQNPFALRAAARSLGQIGSREGTLALIAALQNEAMEDDVRRESAIALGAIGDPAALPFLRAALTARDPYLATAAHESIEKILKAGTQ